MAMSALAALLIASTAAATEKTVALELKLPKKTAAVRPTLSPLLTAGPISLVVKDARAGEDPGIVGIERVRGEDGYSWRAEASVAPAVAEMVRAILADWSVRTAPDAELALTLDLTRFFVTERAETFGSMYTAQVQFKAALADRSGAILWSGQASGEAKESGVDARASMCNEVLSLALHKALAQWLPSVTGEAPAVGAPPAVAAPIAKTSAAPIAIEPTTLFADLTRLKSGGVADDVLVAYVEQRRLTRPLTVDEILAWKTAGIPDAAIKAATRP